uniref:Uncharacterized protein n=1 Tax=Streptomyces avermitilis TaxID=33903 RepID=A0A499VVW4_STRAX|nr:hypothetical protein SAVMC3_89670 [Streptomyces avermitilis]
MTKQVLIITATVTVFAWSVVMVAIGQVAAIATLARPSADGAPDRSRGTTADRAGLRTPRRGGPGQGGSARDHALRATRTTTSAPAPARPAASSGRSRKNSAAPTCLLGPMRETYLTSGLTLSELSARVRLAKSKISELLRGSVCIRDGRSSSACPAS